MELAPLTSVRLAVVCCFALGVLLLDEAAKKMYRQRLYKQNELLEAKALQRSCALAPFGHSDLDGHPPVAEV